VETGTWKPGQIYFLVPDLKPKFSGDPVVNFGIEKQLHLVSLFHLRRDREVNTMIIKQKRNRVLMLFVLLTLLCGERAGAEDGPRFTIETSPGDQGSTVSKIWSVATSIKIREAISLHNSCDRIDGEVNIRSRGREVFVTLKPKKRDLSTGESCVQRETPVMVTVTIPDMPFIPGCHHFIKLETPQRTITDSVIINW
jgi:hypothetical protein